MTFAISDFERNLKNKKAIVCSNPCGPSVLLTAEFFETDQEFDFWKTVSDDDYRLREKAERRERSHTVSLAELPETLTANGSIEASLIAGIDAAAERTRLREAITTLRTITTTTQLRRFWLYVVCGRSRSEIAEMEGVTCSAAAKSIRQARRRISESGLF